MSNLNKSPWLQAIIVVLYSFFGIRGKEDAEADFKNVSWLHYVTWGIIGVLCFVLMLSWVVSKVTAPD